jgi:cytochrome d ubiquinol oxidase subunit I
VEDWSQIIFNPSFPYRFAHMFTASLLTCAFLIAGISAWRARRGVDGPATWRVLKTGIAMAAVLAPLQILLGDLHGLNTLKHQPAKVAAMEGLWETQRGAPFTLIGWPDEEARTNRRALEIPKLASLILTHELDGEVQGLNDFRGEHPPVAPVFWSFRVMVGTGLLMLLTGWWGVFLLWRGGENSPLFLRALSLMTFSGWVAVLAGWYVTEIGRQPWIVQGLLETSTVVASHSAATVGGTLLGYVLLYGFLLVAYIGALRNLASKPARSLERVGVFPTRGPKGATV